MAAGRYTSRRLVDLYSERIAALDRTGPTLRAVIELNPDARAIADRLDAERRAGRVRGPLHGIPVLIKDNIDTADAMMTTAGSLALEGSIAARDAFLVTRLREAGAVILGKTNLSEWANFRSSQFDERLERTRRAGEEPVRARSEPVRLELRQRYRGRCQPCGDRRRHRDRWVDRVSVGRRRPGRDQADRRPGEPVRDHSHFAHARTPPARWRARWRTPPCCSARSRAWIRADRATAAQCRQGRRLPRVAQGATA